MVGDFAVGGRMSAAYAAGDFELIGGTPKKSWGTDKYVSPLVVPRVRPSFQWKQG